MKLEALQSLSVAVMFAGIFLSALGAFGTYYFGGRTEVAERPPPPVARRVAEVKPPARDTVRDEWLASIVEPVAGSNGGPPAPEIARPPAAETPRVATVPVAPKPAAPEPKIAPPPVAEEPRMVTLPVVPQFAAPEPEIAPLPVAEMLTEELPAKTAPVVPKTIATEPAPAQPAIAAPEKPALTKPARVHLSGLGLAPWQLEKMLLRLRAFEHGTIAIQAPEGSEDAWQFADALKEAFVAGGWNVIGVDAVKTLRESSGLTLSSGTFPPPSEVTTVFSALVTAGIKLSTDLDPSQGKTHAVLFVGSRP